MANVKIRLWGQPEEVTEAVRRLGTVLRVVQESSIRQGRRNSSEVWQFLMIALPESHQRAEPLSLFAGLFCQEWAFPDT
ncbi:MAG: hypothetical protein H0T73_12110, partial [Ardenticatenales bacterium]|nr:hypothetical protein [Ardenticatenales bacterium]